jgi:hypothetical protein
VLHISSTLSRFFHCLSDKSKDRDFFYSFCVRG